MSAVAASPEQRFESSDRLHLKLLRSRLITDIPGVIHGITKRVAGLGLADGNVGYSSPRDRADAWEMRKLWMAVAGLNAGCIASAYQAHGSNVAVVGVANAGSGAAPGSRPVGEYDALIAADPGVIPITLHADCMPILICARNAHAVATVHAGWRGTVAGVVEETVRVMSERLGCRPSDLIAFIGPSIRSCCYEVGDDVRQAWLQRRGEPGSVIESWGRRWRFDLAAANTHQLLAMGLSMDRIEDSGICTRCQSSEWFSHRGQGPETGRCAAFIALAER